MSDSPIPLRADDGDRAYFDIRRDGFDGAGWFLVILFVALMYGLALGALSGDRGAAAGDAPRTQPQPALVVHHGP